MRFVRLHLENWKNFRTVEVPLQNRVFLVGPNAAGKSNLLDALRFLRDVAQPKGGGLQSASEDLRPGFSQVRSLHARKQPTVVIDVTVGNAAPDSWRYRLELDGDKHGPRVVHERVWRNDAQLLNRPDEQDTSDKARLRQTYLEQISRNQDFRPLAEFFAGVTYFHLVPQLLREPKRFDVVSRDPFGSDFLRRVIDAPKNVRESRLERIAKALQVAVPNLEELKTDTDSDGTPHLRGRFAHWRPQAGWQSEKQFSDGTLRLLALLWLLLEGKAPLLLEEPELSLNPAVVRRIPGMLHRLQRRQNRQVILSTHSPDMLADEGIDLREILLVRPGNDGSEVRVAADIDEIKALLAHGASPAEAVLPHAEPANPQQLLLFE